jgi:hypothetical protein
MKRPVLSVFWTLFLLVFVAAAVHSADVRKKGWEEGSEYDELFLAEDIEDFKGKIVKIIDVEPMPGMDEGIGIVGEARKERERITVHMGPRDFVKPRMGMLKRGDKVKVYGCFADIEGEEFFMASKVKKDDRQVKVRRTRDGVAWWNFSPEELAAEEAAN